MSTLQTSGCEIEFCTLGPARLCAPQTNKIVLHASERAIFISIIKLTFYFEIDCSVPRGSKNPSQQDEPTATLRTTTTRPSDRANACAAPKPGDSSNDSSDIYGIESYASETNGFETNSISITLHNPAAVPHAWCLCGILRNISLHER